MEILSVLYPPLSPKFQNECQNPLDRRIDPHRTHFRTNSQFQPIFMTFLTQQISNSLINFYKRLRHWLVYRLASFIVKLTVFESNISSCRHLLINVISFLKRIKRFRWKDRISCFSLMISAHMFPQCASRWRRFITKWTRVTNSRVLEVFWLNMTEHFMSTWSSELTYIADKISAFRIFHYVPSYLSISLSKGICNIE